MGNEGGRDEREREEREKERGDQGARAEDLWWNGRLYRGEKLKEGKQPSLWAGEV